jgi:hypothetical protein
LDRCPEVRDIEASPKVVRKGRAQEFDNEVLSLLTDIHPNLVVGQVDNHPTSALRTAPEIDVLQRKLSSG